MNKLVGLWGSTLGKKVLMAGTGIILFGFVVGHMVGNLQIYISSTRMMHPWLRKWRLSQRKFMERRT